MLLFLYRPKDDFAFKKFPMKTIPTLYHGTSIGWLSMPNLSSQNPKNTYGFKLNAGYFGETTDGIEGIWLTEDQNYAERMACIAYKKCIARNDKKLFDDYPLPGPGRMIYTVVLSHPELVVLDLSSVNVSDDMLKRLRRGVQGFHASKKFKVPLGRKIMLKFGSLENYVQRKNGWFEWLGKNLCIDERCSEERDSYADRFNRLALFCKNSGIDAIINPLTKISSNGDLQTFSDGSKPDWMLFNLEKEQTVNGVAGIFRTYTIVDAYGWSKIPR